MTESPIFSTSFGNNLNGQRKLQASANKIFQNSLSSQQSEGMKLIANKRLGFDEEVEELLVDSDKNSAASPNRIMMLDQGKRLCVANQSNAQTLFAELMEDDCQQDDEQMVMDSSAGQD